MNFFSTLYPAALAALLFAAGLGVGRLALRPWRSRCGSPLEFLVFAAGIGMAILSHATLLLGVAGGWRIAGFAALGALAVAAAVAGFRPARGERLDQRWSSGPLTPLEMLALFALFLLVAGQALRATRPDANYDVLEYHVGAVRHWLREGRIFPFPHLFYAALPFEVEMWYAVGCFLEGNPLLPTAPRLINIGILVCTLATLYAVASALTRRRSLRLLACLLFAIHPLTSIVAADSLNDLGLTWFAALACLAWLRWFAKGERFFLVLWAIFLGLTLCCKYTAAGLLIFPAVLFLLPLGLLAAHKTNHNEVDESGKTTAPDRPKGETALSRFPPPASHFRNILLLAVIIAAVFAPWALKNALHHGNPVYPLLSGWFPSPTWSPVQTRYYMAAHGRTTPAHAAYWPALMRDAGRLGWWLIGAAVLGCFVGKSGSARSSTSPAQAGSGEPLQEEHAPPELPRAAAIALALAVVLGLAVHSTFPGNPARFMAPFLPVLAALAARMLGHIRPPQLRTLLAAPLLLWIGLGVVAAIDPPKFRNAAPPLSRAGLGVFTEAPSIGGLVAYLGSGLPRLEILSYTLGTAVVDSQRFVNERTPPNARVFLLYEARIACFSRRVEVGSVFDKSPLLERAMGAKSGAELLERLRGEGFDYLYVNEFELKRLIEMYGPPEAAEARQTLHQSGPGVGEALKLLPLYPPYSLDSRFPNCRAVLEEFVDLCRRGAVYTALPDYPYGLWIASLKDVQPPKEEVRQP